MTDRTVKDRRWAGLAILLAGAFLPPLDFFIVNVALPSIRSDLHAPASTVQLVASGYATAYAVMLITGGRLGDLFGRRNVFVGGMLGFAASSALCGFSWSALSLVIGRIAQGTAAAVMAPQALASIHAIFPEEDKPKALSFYAATFGLASMAGLFLGGALIALNPFGLSWRAIFLINLPVVGFAVPAAFWLLPDTRADHPQRIDVGGAGLLAVTLTALIAPLIEGRQRGWPVWCFLLLAAALPFGFAFWRYENHVNAAGGDPIVAPKLLATPGLGRGLVAALFFYVLAVFWLLFSVYEQTGLKRTPFDTGVAILPAAIGFVLGPFTSAWLARRIGRLAAGAGIVIMALALFATAILVLIGRPFWLFLPLFFIGAGQGLSLPNLVKTVVDRVDQRLSGLASGLINSMFQISGALAVAIIGGVFFGVLGNATDLPAVARAYATGVSAVGFCLLIAAWLVSLVGMISQDA